MAQQKRLELTWHKPSKRWKKQIRGRVIYFGRASAKDDLSGYARALSNYRHWQQTGRRIEDPLPPDADLAHTRQPAPPAPVSVSCSRPLTELLDEYLAFQEQRYRRGLYIETRLQNNTQIPDDRPAGGDTIVYDTYQQILHLSVGLRQACEAVSYDGSERSGALFLGKYREICEEKLFSGYWKPGTFNGAIKIGRAFLGWLYRNYYLQSLPRQLSELCRKYRSLPSARSIPPDALKTLWRHAPSIDGRMRAFMCLGLNCGYYGKDIATLDGGHLQTGWIIRHRRKTGVPTRHKLWDLTRELIAEAGGVVGGGGWGRKSLRLSTGNGGDTIRPWKTPG